MRRPTPPWPALSRPTRRRAAVGALAVAVVAEVLLVRRTTQEHSILGHHDRLLADVLGAWAAAGVALVALRAAALGRRALLLVLVGVAAALRLAAFTAVVPLSDDLYRYAWDGSVQAAGVDPYRYAPDQAPTVPALASRQTDWLFPGAVPGGDTCAKTHDPQGACTRINRPEVRTIYPPVAELDFLAGHLLGASHLRDRGWELVALLPDVGLCALLWRVLSRSGRDPAAAAVYAWSPVAVLEAVQNGHVDGLAALLVVAAVALTPRRPTAGGAVLGLAAMVKLYPALLLPALLGRRPVRVVSAFVGVCVVSYLPHMLVVGGRVVGYLPGYLAEEDYDAGGRYLLLHPLGLPTQVATALVALAGVAVAAWTVLAVRRRGGRPDDPPAAQELARPAAVLLGAALLLASPVQPWYGLTLAGLAALADRPAWLVVPALTYPVFFAVVPAGPSPHAARLGSACFLAALALVVVDAGWRRLRPPAAVRTS